LDNTNVTDMNFRVGSFNTNYRLYHINFINSLACLESSHTSVSNISQLNISFDFISSGSGEGGLVHDAAEILIVLLDSDVSVLTPKGSPGVLNVPGGETLLVSSPTGQKDTVIKLLSAGAGDDTTSIELP